MDHHHLRLIADPAGEPLPELQDRLDTRVVRADGLSPEAARLLETEMLRSGGEAVAGREGGPDPEGPSTLYLLGTREAFERLSKGLEGRDPDGLGPRILGLVERGARRPRRLEAPGISLSYGNGPLVMGILNVTPDSFSDGGRHIDPEAAVARGVAMAREGADVIDVGGESTRPGSEEVPEDEEIRRVVPVIERLADAVDVPLSIDTRKAAVAREALDAGASILNDVSALGHDPEMLEVVGETGAPVVLVHMKGEPRTMQENPVYEDVVAEVYDWLERRAVELEEAGLDPDALVVDPGIGFGKRPEDNLDLLRSIGDFHGLGRAILVGASRKSFLGAVGAGAGPEERLPGSLAAASLCERSGVQWLRVHDVLETRALLDTLRAVRRGEMPGKRKARRASGRSG